MSIIEMKVDPAVLQEISNSLKELTQLLKAKLLADGYLTVPEPRKKTTIDDVTVIDEKRWKIAHDQQEAQKRRLEQVPTEPLMDSTFPTPQKSQSGQEAVQSEQLVAPEVESLTNGGT